MHSDSAMMSDSPPASSALSSSSSSASDDAVSAACSAFVIAADPSAHSAALTALILSVHGKRTSLTHIVSALGTHLTSEQESHRKRSVLLLAELLMRVPALAADHQHAWDTLVAFFSDKLRDECAWKESLMGITALIKRTNSSAAQANAKAAITLSDEAVMALCFAIFDRVSVQSMVQSGRALVFQLLLGFVSSHPAALVELGGEKFVSGVLNAIDGEKDPRNLMLTFKLARFLIVGGWKATLLAPYLEEIFQVTSCYFPITFTPPKNDQIGITSADLKRALCDVMSASGLLAEWSLSFLLEKTESAVAECKIDALDALGECVKSEGYSIQQLDPFLSAIGDAVRKELLGLAAGAAGETPNEQVHAAAARLLATLTRRLAPDSVAGFPAFDLAPSWNLLLGPLLDSIGIELVESPESKSARNHAAMWVLIASSSINAFTRSMAMLYPALERRFGACAEGVVGATQRLALLELIGLLVAAAHQSMAYPIPQHPLQPYAESMMALASSVLLASGAASASASSGVEQRAAGVEILGGMASLPAFKLIRTAAAPSAAAAVAASASSSSAAVASSAAASESRLLTLDQVRLVVSTLTPRLLDDESDVVRNKSLAGLVKIGAIATFDRLVLECTVPALFNAQSKFSLSASSAQAAPSGSEDATMIDSLIPARTTSLEVVLDSAAALCISPALLDAVLPHLLKMLTTHFSRAVSTRDARQMETVHLLLGALIEIVQSNAASEAGRERLASSVAALSKSLISLLLSAFTQSQGVVDAQVVHSIVHIVQLLTRAASAASQLALAQEVTMLFFAGRADSFAAAPSNSLLIEFFPPVSTAIGASGTASLSTSHLQLLPLLTAVVGSLRREVLHQVLPLDSLQRAVTFVGSASASATTTPPAVQSMIELFASVLNKLDVADARFLWCVEHIRALFKAVSSSVASAAATPVSVQVSMLLWSTKALLMRNHPLGGEFTANLLAFLSPASASPSASAVSESVARGLGTLLHDATNVLNCDAFAQCGPGQLYKQRFFVQHLPQLMHVFDAAPINTAAASASASTAAASSVSVPSAVLSSTRFVVLLALSHLLPHVPHQVLLESSSSIVPLLVQSMSHPSSELRVASLHTLSLMLKDEVQRMQPHLHTIVPLLTELLAYKQSMRVRLTCLDCFSYLRRLPYGTLHTHRASILAALALAADDHKRAVRAQAARARNQWFLITE